MLQIKNNSNLLMKASAVLSVVFMTSCGSYSNVSSYTDGIYNEDVAQTQTQKRQQVQH